MKKYVIYRIWMALKEKVLFKRKNKNESTIKSNVSIEGTIGRNVVGKKEWSNVNQNDTTGVGSVKNTVGRTNETEVYDAEPCKEKVAVEESNEGVYEETTAVVKTEDVEIYVEDNAAEKTEEEEFATEIAIDETEVEIFKEKVVAEESDEEAYEEINIVAKTEDVEIYVEDNAVERTDEEEFATEIIVDEAKEDMCKVETAVVENSKEKSDIVEVNEAEKVLARSKKEGVYSDKVALVQAEVNPQYLSHLKEIPETDAFSKLYNRIVKEFSNIKLLCEIDISDDEYRLLCTYFKKRYIQIRNNINNSVVDIIFSVALVQIGMRNYDGNFWRWIDNVLDVKVPLTHRAWIGGTISDTLNAFGKPLFAKQEYVTNILMHCFVTQSFLIKMYDYLFQYYNLDLQRDFGGMKEADLDFLCASIKNPFGMRKQLLSNYTALSMEGNEEYCKSIFYKALQLIDMSFWNEYSAEIVLPERFQKEFEKWKKTSTFYKNEQKRMEEVLLSGKREKVYRSPHLKCNFDKALFNAILPPQMIKESEENKYPTVTWQIITAKTKREIKCSLEEGYSGYKTRELKLVLEPGEILGEINFLLFKDGVILRKFLWSEHKINFFDESGNWISGDSLRIGSCFGFTEIDTEVTSDALLASSIKNNLRFWEFNFNAGDFVQVCGGNSYYVGEVPNTGLTKEYLLKDVIVFTEKEEQVSVYNKLPAYVIDIPIKQFNGTAVYVNGKIEKLSEKDFINVCHAKNDEKKYYFLDLYGLKNIRTGFNEIVIDIPGSTRRLQEKFIFIPNFQYEFEDAPYVFQKRGTLSLNRKIKNGMITDALCESMQNYDFTIDDLNSDYLEFPITWGEETYKMAIRVPIFMYSWDMNNWIVHKSEDIWHSELPSHIYIKFPAEKISLSMGGKSDTMQVTYLFNKNMQGIFVCDLTKLKTRFYDGIIIKKVKLISEVIEYDILRIITRSYLHNVILEVDYEKDCVVWKFDISGKNTYYADIFYKDECLLEKEVIIDGKIETKIPIHSAKYLVKVFESEDEFGFDEEYDFVGQSETTVINPMELTNSCMKLNMITEIENPKNVLEVNYSYYIFIDGVDEDMDNDKHYYTGVLTGVFHDSVMCASKAKIYIPNLNDIYHVFISFIDEYGDNCEFLYDSYTNSINECENSRFTKSEAYRRYEMLYTDMYVWDVKYVGSNLEIEKKAKNWIVNHNKRKIKQFWKEENYDLRNNSIDELELSNRTYHCLRRAGLLTIEQVIEAYQKGTLMKTRNLGQNSYNEVYLELCKRNLI